MTIPEVRKALLALADELDASSPDGSVTAGELRTLVQELYRRPYVRKARTTAKHVPIETRRAVALANPDLPQREVGRLLGVDGGRISEALAGFRT